MRKLIIALAIFTLVNCFACEALFSAEPKAAAKPAVAKRPLRFLFVAPCVDEEFYIPLKKGMREAAEAMGVECKFVGTEGVDLPAQCDMVRKAIQEGYDGLAVSIVDAHSFEKVLAEAREKGVPVVAFNIDGGVDKSLRMSAVCQDLYEAGRSVGREAAKKLPAGCKVLFTEHDAGISALDDRLRGIQEVLKEKNITGDVVITGTTPEASEKVIAKALKEDPSIKAVLATGQADTEGAALAVSRAGGKRKCYIAGFDLSPVTLRFVKKGVVDFTVDQQPYAQGFYPVVQLAHYVRYGVRPSNIDTGATVVRAADVDRVHKLSHAGYR